jgi:ATP-dependent RNA helicase DDX24/MAK5
LNDLSRVRFLIIDEADRMIQQGSFPQLARILDAVQKANPTDDDDDEEELGEEGTDITEEDGDTNRLFGLPGIPGEAKVTMLNASILQQIEEVKNGSKSGPPVVEEICSGEEDVEAEGFEGGSDDGSDPISLPGLPPVYRQTFVYSATLTLPSSGSALQSKKKKRARSNKDVDGAIAEILEKSRAKGTTKVVDLSHLDKRDKAKSVPITAQTDDRSKANAIPAGPAGQFRLPPGLTLQQIKCTQRHKDSHLYAYLLTTDAGASGPSLVFCNSIAAVRRVGATMQTLGLQVRVLHAQMQQVRQRCVYQLITVLQ